MSTIFFCCRWRTTLNLSPYYFFEGHEENQKGISTKMSITVENDEDVDSISDIRKLYNVDKTTNWGIQKYKIESKLSHVEAELTGVNGKDVVNELIDLNARIGGNVLKSNSLSFVKAYIEDSTFKHKTIVYGVDVQPVDQFDILVKCALQPPYRCSITVTKVERSV